jgi:formate/nitrite transporter FocA (FNT family)
MDYLNWIDISQLYIHPTYLWAAIIGGMIMGVGFLAGGFCPGTSLCAVAIGKIDGMVFTLGLILGIFIFSESFSALEPFFEGSNLGHITLVDSFGISPYWIIFVFTIIALVAFYFSDWVRSKVKKVFY